MKEQAMKVGEGNDLKMFSGFFQNQTLTNLKKEG